VRQAGSFMVCFTFSAFCDMGRRIFGKGPGDKSKTLRNWVFCNATVSISGSWEAAQGRGELVMFFLLS